MTVENHIRVSINEIKNIIFVCHGCKTEIRIRPEAPEWRYQCPVCSACWVTPQQLDTPNIEKRAAKIALVKAIEKVRRVMEDDKLEGPDQTIGFTILLEFDKPSS